MSAHEHKQVGMGAEQLSPEKKKHDYEVGTRVIWSHIKEHKQVLSLLVFLGLCGAAAEAYTPYIGGRLIDALNGLAKGAPDPFAAVIPVLSIWAFVSLLSSLFAWVASNKNNYFRLNFRFGYVAKGVTSLLLLPISFHKDRKTGALTDKINQAGQSISSLLTTVLVDLTPNLVSVIIGLGIAYSVNVTLANVVLVGIVIYVAVLLEMIPKTMVLEDKVQKFRSEGMGYGHDVMANASTVKQASAEAYETKKITSMMAGEIVHVWYRMNKMFNSRGFVQNLITLATRVAIFVLSVLFLQNGTMTIGVLFMFNGYAAMVFGPFARLAIWWGNIQEALVAAAEADAILSIPAEVYKPKGAKAITVRGKVEFKNVSFTYKPGDPQVLNDVSLSVEPGEIVALVGESGVGKSTLVDLISGYYFPSSGMVSIDGHDVQTLQLKNLRDQIAIVPQEVNLFNATIRENMIYGKFDASDAEMQRVAHEARAEEFIEKFPQKYGQLVGNRGVMLSVGQKQRIAIARAMLRDPKILILDEPTSALDSQTEVVITEALERLMRGRTTFIVAHRLSTVRKAHRIFVVKDGKIVEEGSHTTLVAIPDGEYRKLYELHIGLHE